MPEFNRLIRALRQQRGASHRAIGEAIGLQPSSAQNVEHKPYKSLARPKVERLAAFYGLDAAARAALLAAWEALPVSPYSQQNAGRWTARRQVRAKARHHDAMKLALIDLLAVYLEGMQALRTHTGDESPLCTCTPADPFADAEPRLCELCAALRVIGYPTAFNGADAVLAFLAGLAEPAEAA